MKPSATFKLLCALFKIFLNGTPISAEETTLPQATPSNDGNDNITTPAEPTKQNENTTDAPNKTTDVTAQPKQDNDATLIASTEKPQVTATQSTESIGRYSKETTKSVSEGTTNKTTTEPESKTKEAIKHVKEKGQNVEDVVKPLLEKPKLLLKGENLPSNISRSGTDSEAPTPSYIGKLTGSLVLPALKARQTLGNAWNKSNQGFKEIGSGTYEAAAGAFNFVKDATSAVFNG